MELYAAALTYVIPIFIGLVAIEAAVARFKGVDVMNVMDTVASLSSGITNILKSIVGLSIVIVSYDWMVSHIALIEIPNQPLVYIITFILLDFAGYWSHRFNHVVNLFWNRHIIHHSSEEFNLACALRQTIADFVQIYFFLYIPLALIGIPAQVVAIVAPIHLFAQFWYHTQLIDRMGWLEHIIVTPSHHRVHHAINPEYIDKNYSTIFIVWDKWFGTFQEELRDVPPVYGITRAVRTWNPILINFQHLWLLISDAWRTKSWKDKARIWFMPTGWRPEDVAEKYPVYSTKDPYDRPKYLPPATIFLKSWAMIQLVVHTLLLYYMLYQLANIGFANIGLYTAFLVCSIFSYTALMDRMPWAKWVELIKVSFMGVLIYANPDWFGLYEFYQPAYWTLIIYGVVSFIISMLTPTVKKDSCNEIVTA